MPAAASCCGTTHGDTPEKVVTWNMGMRTKRSRQTAKCGSTSGFTLHMGVELYWSAGTHKSPFVWEARWREEASSLRPSVMARCSSPASCPPPRQLQGPVYCGPSDCTKGRAEQCNGRRCEDAPAQRCAEEALGRGGWEAENLQQDATFGTHAPEPSPLNSYPHCKVFLRERSDEATRLPIHIHCSPRLAIVAKPPSTKASEGLGDGSKARAIVGYVLRYRHEIHGQDKGQWRDAIRRRQLQTAIF